MANMRMDKTPMPEQDPHVRVGNFDEVALGYTADMAVEEAQRCLHCREPRCISGCPLSVPIPDFVARIAQGDFKGAYEVLSSVTGMPAVCGRVCPQDVQCEGSCIRGIKGEPVAIGRLERFAADRHMEGGGDSAVPAAEPNGHRVAVIGAGPAGLTCAGELARMGYDVTVFEALDEPGGLLTHGIPAFRLPREVAAREIALLEGLGVRTVTRSAIGKMDSVDELFEQGFEAVFIGSGAGVLQRMEVPGEDLPGVLSARDLLMGAEELELSSLTGRRVAVVGDGDMALDAARTALRLGADAVTLLCSVPAEGMTARREEVARARDEGVVFLPQAEPVEVLAGPDGHVKELRFRNAALGGAVQSIGVNAVIVAIGGGPDPILLHTTPGLNATEAGGVAASAATGETSRVGVFAGGDAVTGAATVIRAMVGGKAAAKGIDGYIRSR